ncbi:hypothetical protein D9M71_551800 [compost metagenome]
MADPVHRAGDAVHLAVGGGDLPQPGALVAGDQAVVDLPLDQRREQGNRLGLVEQADQPHQRAQQGRGRPAEEHAGIAGLAGRGGEAALQHDFRDHAQVQLEHQAQVRERLVGLDDVHHRRQVQRGDQEVVDVVGEGFLAEQGALGALHDDEQARPHRAVVRQGRRGAAEQAQVGDGRLHVLGVTGPARHGLRQGLPEFFESSGLGEKSVSHSMRTRARVRSSAAGQGGVHRHASPVFPADRHR